MDQTNSPFAITLLPWHEQNALPGLYLSLCIELNRAYDHSTHTFEEWYGLVRGFHGGFVQSQYGRLLEWIQQDAFVVDGRICKGTLCRAPVCSDAIELWAAMFTDAKPRDARLTSKEARVSEPPPSPLSPPIVGPAGDAGVEGTGTLGNVVKAMLTTGPMSGVRTLSQAERRGIVRAADDLTKANADRVLVARSLRHDIDRNLEMSGADRSLRGLAVATQSMLKLTADVFTGSVEYVQHLFDSLGGSPQLRRTFGMTIDVRLPDAVNLPRDFDIAFVPGPLRGVFFALPTGLTRVKGVGSLMVAEPPPVSPGTPVLENGVLQLQRARVLGFEPQSVAASGEEIARDAAQQPQTFLQENVAVLRSPAAMVALRSRAATPHSMSVAEVAEHLRTLRRERQQQAFVVQQNNRQTNTPTRGLVVYHTDADKLVKELGTKDDSDDRDVRVLAPGAIHGFVVYVRRIDGSPSPWMPLTTVSESLTWHDAQGPVARPGGSEELQLGVHVGGAVHVAAEPDAASGAEPSVYELRDGFILAWDGTGISTQSPLRHRERGEGATAEDDLRAALLAIRRGSDLNELELLAAQQNTRTHFAVEWFPFPERRAPPARLVARRSHARPPAAPVKLSFSRYAGYQFLAVAQYHNGYSPIAAAGLDAFVASATRATPFLRYDHIRDLIVGLEREIYADPGRKTLRREHAGESETHLVVRTGDLLDTDSCTRLLFPPPLPTFQTYLWYHREDLEAMGPPRAAGGSAGPRLSRALNEEQLAVWYQRYTCDARTAGGFTDNQARARRTNELAGAQVAPEQGCAMGCGRFCGGTAQPPVYDGRLRYLPDPVVAGVRMAFFEDAACAWPAEAYATVDCFYRDGTYPDLRPWRLVLEKRATPRAPTVKLDEEAQTLTVRLPAGKTLYVRATPMHDPRRTHFAPSQLENLKMEAVLRAAGGHALSGQVYLADETHANVTTFTLTHAVQRPLVKPTLGVAHVRRFNPAVQVSASGGPPPTVAMFELDLDVCMEWLNFVHGVSDPEVAPTGELELFALWDDYNDHHDGSSLTIEQKRDPRAASGGFVRVAKLRREDFRKLSSDENPPKGSGTGCYTVHPTFRSEQAPFTNPQHTRVIFRVRNTSSFYSYFHLGSVEMFDEEVELHSRWSDELPLARALPHVDDTPGPIEEPEQRSDWIRATFMPNNIKPQRPTVEKIVSLVTRDDDRGRGTMQYRGNRVRVYFTTEGRQNTGPDRIGIVVAAGAASHGSFQGLVSRAGQDIVTDGPRSGTPPTSGSWLHADAFVRSEALEPAYRRRFDPRYEEGLFATAPGIGLVSYTPRFDETEGLWYVDVELAVAGDHGRVLHNPFVQLTLVTYQPHGANYGPPKSADGAVDASRPPLELDFRVSDVQPSEFFSIYPSRDVRNPLVLFSSSRGDACTLSGAVSSLYFRQLAPTPLLRTQFVAEVQRCDDGGIWRTIDSVLRTCQTAVDRIPIPSDVQHPADLKARRHLLLPESMGTVAPGAYFECRFALRFDTGIFDSPRSGRYRVLIREVDWFPPDDTARWTWRALQEQMQQHDIAQLPDLRTRQIMLLTPR